VSATARIRTLAGTLTAGLLLTALVLLPGGAGAQSGAKPTPCTGEMLITDPAGDQEVAPLIGDNHAAPPNQDITGVFLNYKDGHLTANIQIKNLTKDLPDQMDSQGGAYWYLWYTDGDTRRFVKAVDADGSTVTYAYGEVDPLGAGAYLPDGDTTGEFFEGPDGIVQIEIPADAGAVAGSKLTGIVATADDIIGLNDVIGLNSSVDFAPDDGTSIDASSPSVDYTVTACPAAPPSGGTTTTPPAGGSTTPTTTELPLKVTKVLDGAKKAKKKKALRLSVSTTDTITDLSLSLKGKSGTGKTYAGTKVASLSGTATLKLKLKAKLKAGSYSLVAKGTVNGTKLSKKLSVKVKK
jgi:hypothetical protein